MPKDKTRDKLLELLAQGKKYTQGELAKELGTKQSAISKQLKRMEKRGWVIGHGTTSNRHFELTKNGISAAQNPSQNGISRASKPENGISYTGNVFLVINALSFKEMIEGAVNLKDTEKAKKALIRVGMDGIEIKQLDSSGISMIVARIPKAQFISYRLGSPENIGIYVERVSRLIESMPNDKELTIAVLEQDGKKRLRLECEGNVSSVSIEEGVRGMEKEPHVVFKSVAEIDGKLLHKTVREVAKAGDDPTVAVKISKDGLGLAARLEGGGYTRRTFDRSQVRVKADAQEQIAAYKTEYIESMLKGLKKDTPVTIQLTTKEPIRISYRMDGVDFAYYLAPYIEDE
jgi:DNA-binding Lrp family transcriptional regulator